MTFSLSVFLYLYIAFLVIWFVLFLVAIYHMLKFGFKNFTTFFTTFLFIATSFAMLLVSFNYISQIDWTINVEIFKGLFNSEMPF